MNRKGFTLIELLAVILIIGLLGVIVVPNALSAIDKSKTSSYNTLIKNIVTSSQLYYEECEYGDLSDNLKYEEYACEIVNDSETMEKRISHAETTLGALANTGFLNVKDTDTETEEKIVKDPKTNNDISNCIIKITKVVDLSTYKVTYKIIGSGTNCPTTDEYEEAE